MTFLQKLAAVFEAAADELDRKPQVIEVVKEADNKISDATPEAKVAALYKERTGSDLDPEVAKLLGNSKVAEAVNKLAGVGDAPTALGGPSDRDVEGKVATSRDEVVAAAHDRFGRFLINSGRG
jgi:hypothetical protein